ncbi:TBC1 domain member 4 [Goodea atripinnis]|uniref:TBC1 domain member 4 n=1 Tax=Goodea atripinnis TaxID=208336 RepID=A0ABV0N774_9TELE
MSHLPIVNMESQEEKEIRTDKRFALTYVGWCSLDRRTTLPMLPWLVAEIRRRSERGDCGPVMQPREVQLLLNPPFVRCVPSNSSNSSVFIFEHKAQLVSRFIHNSNELTCFSYLLRGQPDNPESEMSCHVFKACDPNQVGVLKFRHTSLRRPLHEWRPGEAPSHAPLITYYIKARCRND